MKSSQTTPPTLIRSLSLVQKRELIINIASENQETGVPISVLLKKAAIELGVPEKSVVNLWNLADPSLKLKHHASQLLSDKQARILVLTAQALLGPDELSSRASCRR
jgi:hypothetical protein